jgi:hypothetical protein
MEKIQDVKAEVDAAIKDFLRVLTFAKAELSIKDIKVEVCSRPHRPPSQLPANHIAVYAFFLDGRVIKVGKAGEKTRARYTSQHYSPESCRSNLAKSILAYPKLCGASQIGKENIASWIKNRTDRVNILLPSSSHPSVLSLLEAFLHVRWLPVYEGAVRSQS